MKKELKYYLDTEFHEYAKQLRHLGVAVGRPINTIDPISFGLVCEDNRAYYAVCKEFDIDEAWNNEWLRINVLLPIFFDFANYDFHTTHFKDQWLLNGEEVNLQSFKSNTVWSDDLKWFKKMIHKYGKTRYQIAKEILQFVGGNANELREGMPTSWTCDTEPIFWAYFADYDWVVFCWLYGRMIDLPKGYPMFCMDLKQKMEFYGLDGEWKNQNCPDPEGVHNALEDAKWNKLLDDKINEKISTI